MFSFPGPIKKDYYSAALESLEKTKGKYSRFSTMWSQANDENERAAAVLMEVLENANQQLRTTIRLSRLTITHIQESGSPATLQACAKIQCLLDALNLFQENNLRTIKNQLVQYSLNVIKKIEFVPDFVETEEILYEFNSFSKAHLNLMQQAINTNNLC